MALDAVTAAGTALGVLVNGRISADFFADPAGHVGRLLSDRAQRTALLELLPALLPSTGPAGARYVLVQEGPLQVLITVDSSDLPAAPVVVLGVAAELVDRTDGVTVSLAVPLVRGSGNTAVSVAASVEVPARLEVRLELPGAVGTVAAGAELVAPPHADRCRFVLRIERPGAPVVEFDPLSGAAVGTLLAGVVQLLLGFVGPEVPEQVRIVAAHLPGLLGLGDDVPPLPLVPGGEAFRAWVARLVGAPGGAELPLRAWLDHLAGLLGTEVSAGAGVPTEAAPAVVRLFELADVAIDLAVAVRAAAPPTPAAVLVNLQVRWASPTIDAAVVAAARVLTLPLDAELPPGLLDSVEIVVHAPRGAGPLYAAGPVADPDFRVGGVRAGLRWAGDRIEPLLALNEVRVRPQPGAPPVEIALLDLSSVDALVGGAATALADAFVAGTGAGNTAEAVLTLMGLARPAGAPAVDAALLISDPVQALSRYYRALRADAAGFAPLVRAVWALLGGDPGGPLDAVAVEGSAAGPWLIRLDHLPAPAGSFVRLAVVCRDDGGGGAGDDVRIRLGLRADVEVAATPTTPSVVLQWQPTLVGADLTPDGGAVAVAPGAQRLELRIADLPGPAAAGGVTVTADTVTITVDWAPGASAKVAATIAGVHLGAGGVTVDLGEVRLPGAGADSPDLGLGAGLGPDELWAAVRILVVAGAEAMGGSIGSLLAAVAGAPTSRWPSLPTAPPPDPFDLRTLLDDPLAALTRSVQAMLFDDAIGSDGTPFPVTALQVVQAVLTPDGVDGPPGSVPPVQGAGTAATPWSAPLHRSGESAVEFLSWLAPDGPPSSWPSAVLAADAPPAAVIGADQEDDADEDGIGFWGAAPTGADLIALARRLQLAGVLGAGLDGVTDEVGAGLIDLLADALAGSDGLIAVVTALPGSPAWTELLVQADHGRIPAAVEAVAAVAGLIADARSGGGDVVLVALDSGLAELGAWEALVGVAGPVAERVSLRRPGIDPMRADLGAIGSADAYVVDLADDGTAKVDAVVARLLRVVERVRAVRTAGTRIVLVGHSYTGVVAAAFAAAHADAVAAVVALGAPLAGPDVLVGASSIAEAVRLVAVLGANGLTGPAGAAVTSLGVLLDGQVTEPGIAPVPRPFPAAAFARGAAALPEVSVPAVAVAGVVPDDLRSALRSALDTAAPPARATEPVELRYGMRFGLVLPAAPDEPDVSVDVRVDAGGAPGVEVRVRIISPDGWVLGGPGDGSVATTRVRWVEMRGWTAGGGGIELVLHDAWWSGFGAARVTLDHPAGGPLLDALVQQWRAASTGGALRRVLDALIDIGLVARAGGRATVLADAVTALATDPAGYLAPRLPALLDRTAGLFGLHKDAGAAAGVGPWRLIHQRLPVELVVTAAPWRAEVRTTGAGLPVGRTTRVRGGVDATAGPAAAAAGELVVDTGATVLRATSDGPAVTIGLPGQAGPLTLLPADAATLRARLLPIVPSAVAGAVLGTVLGELTGIALRPIAPLLDDPLGWLRASLSWDGALDPQRVRALLAALGDLTGLDGGEAPIVLPGGVAVDATATESVVQLSIGTDPPLSTGDPNDPVTVDLAVGIGLPPVGAARPSGSITARIPLPGPWQHLEIAFATTATGVSLSLRPEVLGTTITLLPTVSGLDALAGAAAGRLLPTVLDELVAGLSAEPGSHDALDAAVAVASALGIADAVTGTFDGAALATLVADVQSGALTGDGPARAGAVAALLGRVLGPATVQHTAGEPTVGVVLAGGALVAEADLADPFGVGITATGLQLGLITADIAVRGSTAAASARLTVAPSFDVGRGLVLTPALAAEVTAAGVRIELRPLGDDQVLVPLAPAAALPGPQQLAVLARRLAVPVAVRLAIEVLDPRPAPAGTQGMDRQLWAGGPTAADLVVAAGVATRTATGLEVLPGGPQPAGLARGVVDVLRGQEVALGDTGLAVGLAVDGDVVGLALHGAVAVPASDLVVAVRLGVPPEAGPGWDPTGMGLQVLLLSLPAAGDPVVMPRLRLGGVGLALSRADGAPLIDTTVLRIGAIAGTVLVTVPLTGPGALSPSDTFRGAVELTDIGLPIAAGGNGGNPVAASLLQSRGPGDATPANPPVSILVGTTDGGLVVRFAGQPSVRIPVHRTFGPLTIEELAFGFEGAPAPVHGRVGIGVTGGIAVGPLAIGVQDLTLEVPLGAPADLEKWGLDLAGLALRFEAGVVNVVGGLLRTTAPNGTVQYDGSLAVSVAGRTLSAVGSYARPVDDIGSYTSLFVFVSVPFPLGGPPYFFVLGLAGGIGYNRRLRVPDDPLAVPTFPLVAALSGTEGDPMAALRRVATDVPPSRGSFWVAGGVRFTTFGLLQGTALAYVALDRGLELGLLGLLQLQLPPGAPIVSVELALSARFSTVDMMLSVRAGLTRNSWLLSQDCRLTGGFAFVAWFNKPEVLLTIGGYRDGFPVPAHWPRVDRVGLQWAVADGIVVKGGSYFALTHSALMVGASVQVTARFGPIRAWLTAGFDATITWDPFAYDVTAWISIGVALHIEICFIGCISKDIGGELGAWLHIEGPPLHGSVRASFLGFTIPVEFGQHSPQPFLTWAEVVTKYLSTGTAGRPATPVAVASGVRPGAGEAKGGPADPLPVGAEVVLTVGSTMPARTWRLVGATAGEQGPPFAVPDRVDVVPAGPAFAASAGRVRAVLTVMVQRFNGVDWQTLPAAELDRALVTAAPAGFPAAVWSSALAVDPLAPMVTALGSVQVRFPSAREERTGALGAASSIALATLVEETPVRGLPLPAPPVPAPPDNAPPPAAPPPLAPPLPVAPVAVSSRLHTVLEARAARVRPSGGPVRLAAGAAAVWDVPGAARLRLRGSGGRVRLVALSGAGGPLADLTLPGRQVPAQARRLSAEASRIVVVGGADTGPAGWQSHSMLVQVGPATLLAPGATVLAATALRAVAVTPGAGEVRRLPASAVVATQPRLTTILPAGTTVVIVQAFARAGAATSADGVSVRLDDAIGDPQELTDGSRLALVVAVDLPEAVQVVVDCDERWWPAGVVGVTGDPATWADRLRAEPDAVLVTNPAGSRSVPVIEEIEERTRG
ncbi:hypothetical protein SAMN05660657_04453 [Geodermatophilus amargosae]|uniref:DUF6603 domain-containing protein n=1 Tax=Geodermatophilus amargosae TaxID=1296565 RepID=A0A1I7CGK5_9ACTN|nr:DUF6603 domain-containing protein [Geodermatophilus amargosae]SFT98522.1 hypothetical protein SAMN05660657_04453 [Geodermatophilus amargosae]